MADYSNPRLPEGINNSERRPLRDLLWLTGGVLGGIAALVLILGLLAQWIAPKVPFAYEAGLAEPMVAALTRSEEPPAPCIEPYLQGLADRLAQAQNLPDGMSIDVHYVDDDTVNAIATLGGHVLIYRGLLQKLPHENALATVLSHEIAHVHHRDAVVALGRGVAVGIALAALSGVSSSSLADWMVGEAGMLTQLGFSRRQERAADSTGLAAVAALYGHTAGAEDLYRVLMTEASDGGFNPEFFETHPDTVGRIDAIRAQARAQGWQTEGTTTTLPDWLPHALGPDGSCRGAEGSSGG